MKTPHLDEAIEQLKGLYERVGANSIKEKLQEYEAIKEALSIHLVSNCPDCGSDRLVITQSIRNKKFTTMKIYLILAIINYLIFCFDVEYDRDVMSWIWLGTAIGFSYAYHINRKTK